MASVLLLQLLRLRASSSINSSFSDIFAPPTRVWHLNTLVNYSRLIYWISYVICSFPWKISWERCSISCLCMFVWSISLTRLSMNCLLVIVNSVKLRRIDCTPSIETPQTFCTSACFSKCLCVTQPKWLLPTWKQTSWLAATNPGYLRPPCEIPRKQTPLRYSQATTPPCRLWMSASSLFTFAGWAYPPAPSDRLSKMILPYSRMTPHLCSQTSDCL